MAIIVNDWSHIELSYVVPFYSDGSDISPLVELLRHYATYPAELMNATMFILVDDGSPSKVEIPADIDLNIRVLRVDEDIAWNQPGARNLGATMSVSDKIIMTDIDHEMTVEAFDHMIKGRNPGRTIYKFRRETKEGGGRKSHPNTFFLSRARFLRYYGYDEEFCGHYGFDDAMLWRWQRYHGTRFMYLPACCKALLHSAEKADGFHSLKRDLDHNKKLAAEKRRLWREYGPKAGYSRLFLNFKWHAETDRVRSIAPAKPPQMRHWIHTWWWRWLLPVLRG